MDTTGWIQYGGLLVICLMMFSSTGLFCFFLPVGAVMFTTGVLVASGNFPYPFVTVCAMLILSTLAGNCTGYTIGRQIGSTLYTKKETWYFKQHHLRAADSFYHRYGGWAICGGIFLPIVRTFSPVVAGIVRMTFSKMFIFSIIGAVASVITFVGAGFFIGSRPLLQPYLPWVVGGFIIVVTIPILVRIIKQFSK